MKILIKLYMSLTLMATVKHKIEEAINRLDLDLSGKIVLTEAATGAYVVTSVIATLAGAEVYAFTKNTSFGNVNEVKRETFDLLRQFNVAENRLTIVEELTPEIISKANIITNCGHLRPINQEKLKYAKMDVVISLMYEAWELRDSDLDIKFCRQRDIKVGAVNERHPDVDVFNYLGDMVLRMILDSGLCPFNNNFILICNNDFGPYIASVLSKVCRGLAISDKRENREKYNDIRIDWIGEFPDFIVPENYKNSDAVIFTAYPFNDIWIGNNNEPISIKKLITEINNPYILRFAGDIDEESCYGNLNYYPKHVIPGHMGILPSAIGFDPIIRLQAGGLKVGEMLLRDEKVFNGISLLEIV